MARGAMRPPGYLDHKEEDNQVPLLKSWVKSANDAEGPFPLNNLPYGVFRVGDEAHCGVAIGDRILDVTVLEEEGVIDLEGGPVFEVPCWNEFMELGPEVWSAFRARLQELLAEGGDSAISGNDDLRARALLPGEGAEMLLPIVVAEYTDFYAGRNHAFNWARCSGGRKTRCRRTGYTYRSGITGARLRLSCREQKYAVPGGS